MDQKDKDKLIEMLKEKGILKDGDELVSVEDVGETILKGKDDITMLVNLAVMAAPKEVLEHAFMTALRVLVEMEGVRRKEALRAELKKAKPEITEEELKAAFNMQLDRVFTTIALDTLMAASKDAQGIRDLAEELEKKSQRAKNPNAHNLKEFPFMMKGGDA